MIATNITCQPETIDIISIYDLNIMWAIDKGVPLDWFEVFTKKFCNMRNQFGILDFVGCTSLITLIAQVCVYNFYGNPDEYRELDLHCLRKLQLLACKSEVHMSLTDVSKDDPEESKKDEEEKKRRMEIEKGKSVNSKVP